MDYVIIIFIMLIMFVLLIDSDVEKYDNIISLTATPLIDVQRIDKLEDNMDHVKSKLDFVNTITNKMYESDLSGNYIANGWFVTTHNVVNTPYGIELSSLLKKFYAIKDICFKVKSGFPFLGYESDPIFLQKQEKIGFRAMTVFKIPKTAKYTFTLSTNDGGRLFYQKVYSNILFNEKNARSKWNYIINAWFPQSETYYMGEQLEFNESELVLLRLDWYTYALYSTCCIKVIINDNTPNAQLTEINLPIDNLFCSLVWADIPLMGIF